MDAIYYQNLESNTQIITPNDDEFRHLKALRIAIGEHIIVTNGKGLTAECMLTSIDKKSAKLTPINFHDHLNEKKNNVILALGILSNKDRMEFALEKAIEVGISGFIPLKSAYTQKNYINHDRLLQKAIASIKQCKRSILPQIEQTTTIKQVSEKFLDEYQFIMLDENGIDAKSFNYPKKSIIFVGPEGGFSEEEISLISSFNAVKINLGNSRLRAETAAIIGTAFALL